MMWESLLFALLTFLSQCGLQPVFGFLLLHRAHSFVIDRALVLSSLGDNDLFRIEKASEKCLPLDGAIGSPHVVDAGTPRLINALEHFLSVCKAVNQQSPRCLEIISRGFNKIPKHQEVDTAVFVTDKKDCLVTISPKGKPITLSNAQEILAKSSLDPADPDEAVAACGFGIHSVPPLGHYSNQKVDIVIDQDMLLYCQSNDLVLLANGGYAYWQCLVTPDVLLSLENIHVVPLVDNEENSGVMVDEVSEQKSTVGNFLPSGPVSFLDVEPPPSNVARLVVEKRDLSNPFSPQVVIIKGRIGCMDRIGKRNANLELLPITIPSRQADLSAHSIDITGWVSRQGRPMKVILSAGKTLLQKLGTTQGEAAIERLQEGVIIQAEARTNVGNRDSLSKWVNEGVLQLLLTDFQLYSDDGRCGESMSATAKSASSHPQNNVTLPILPDLSLEDLFGGSYSVEVVDSAASVDSLVRDYDILQLSLANGEVPLVGIDCEWQPHQLSSSAEARPVLLMQLSIHDLGKVYLLDLQTLLRPLMDPKQTMNDIETLTSNILSKLFKSEGIIKVGYQLASDLRRLVASYPHLRCFRQVNCVLEVDNFLKRILHVTKQKKSRAITMSLGRMTSHYLGMAMNKSSQISDWKMRPLTESQIEYAALDAAVTPALVEKAMESVNATIKSSIPRFERFDGDESMAKVLLSMRFSFVEVDGSKAAKKLQAKKMMGDRWVRTRFWVPGNELEP